MSMNKSGLSDIIGYLMAVNKDFVEFDDLTITVVIDNEKLRVRKNWNGLTMTLKPVDEVKWLEPNKKGKAMRYDD